MRSLLNVLGIVATVVVFCNGRTCQDTNGCEFEAFFAKVKCGPACDRFAIGSKAVISFDEAPVTLIVDSCLPLQNRLPADLPERISKLKISVRLPVAVNTLFLTDRVLYQNNLFLRFSDSGTVVIEDISFKKEISEEFVTKLLENLSAETRESVKARLIACGYLLKNKEVFLQKLSEHKDEVCRYYAAIMQALDKADYKSAIAIRLLDDDVKDVSKAAAIALLRYEEGDQLVALLKEVFSKERKARQREVILYLLDNTEMVFGDESERLSVLANGGIPEFSEKVQMRMEKQSAMRKKADVEALRRMGIDPYDEFGNLNHMELGRRILTKESEDGTIEQLIEELRNLKEIDPVTQREPYRWLPGNSTAKVLRLFLPLKRR